MLATLCFAFGNEGSTLCLSNSLDRMSAIEVVLLNESTSKITELLS